MEYNFNKIEKKWQEYWDNNKTFFTDVWDFSKPKFYALDMFPYPSGQGLHVGHPEGYTATDIISRMKRMQGYNVLHPMGWDAFGLPAEQYAIKTGNHPAGFTKKNIETFKKQLKMLGLSFDWDKEISTCDPNYYKWTQWIFKQLYKDGLAKLVEMPVNWCEGLGCVLSNDEVINGRSERGDFPVVRKNMKQWVLDIPKYADILLDGLEDVDWPESTKEIQRNWIGKSEGAEVTFKVDGFENLSFTVFTTRPDTLFGATYCVLAPELNLVNIITTDSQKNAIEEYKKQAASKSDLERTELNKEKTGVFTGSYAINPVNNKKIPIWISDYVLSTYGTGAIMAVPAHDQRDYEFATKFGIEIIPVLEGGDIQKEAFVGDGVHINSEFLNGLNKKDSIDKIINWLEEKNIGKKKVNYKLREWIFARQRYWGEPIPIVYLDDEMRALADSDLPLVLPELEDYAPSKSGASPLDKATNWVNTSFEGKAAKRETSTMPGSAGSSWYFLRYIDPKNNNEFADSKKLKYWLPVDCYNGGMEHVTRHLIYSRFWHRFLYDIGLVPTKEPYSKRTTQGLILGPDGDKMSKSKGNVINPDDIVKEYGADTLRTYILFIADYKDSAPWNENGVKGCKKFLDRVTRIEEFATDEDITNDEIEKELNKTIKKVSEDYEEQKYNTAIAAMMTYVNLLYKQEKVSKKYIAPFLQILNPIASHVTEELWERLGFEGHIFSSKWPEYDISKIIESNVELAVQINGKVRFKITVPTSFSEEEIKEQVKNDDKLTQYIDGKQIQKIIVIKSRIVNIVVK